ncbi:MAG: FHA domain-containing protein [Eubacterium sp.]|nr:FHA domain-containing protein [Eubacterium sp.]
MELKRCVYGHTYDPSIYPECPECAKLKGETVPLDHAMFGAEDYGKTQPLHSPTQPINHGQDHWADASNYKEADAYSENYAPTMPIGYQDSPDKAKAQLPVTGWLVCIDGASKGSDYRIHEEYNYIGRSSKMDICIQGDPTVSRENHAIIAYDKLEKLFYIAPSGGGSIIRVNGKAVLSSMELNAFDKVSIGQSVFLFVPFCGERFDW